MAESASFYGAAAGALPLLYIALAVEERSSAFLADLVALLVRDEERRPVMLAVVRGVYLLVVGAILASGIAAAFVGLANPDWALDFSTGYTAWFVLVALVVGGGLLVVQPFVGIAIGVLKARSQSPRASAIVLLIALASAAGVLYVAQAIVSGLLH